MFKKEYYCLVAGLPDLFFNENKLVFNSLQFRHAIKSDLSKSDYKLVEFLFYQFDNENVLDILFKEKVLFNCHGVFTKRNMESELENPVTLPEYLIDFLKWNKLRESKNYSLKAENKLHELFYNAVFQLKNEFLVDWYEFELNIKNTFTAFNCSRFNYPAENHLIKAQKGTNVYDLLVNLRLKHELFNEELPFAEQIFRIAESDSGLLEKEKSVDKIKWEYLDDATFFHYFTIEKVLSYILKLFIVERWIKLDAETGKELLDKLVKEIESSYEFTEEYAI